MKVERHDSEPERSILIAFIVSTETLSKLSPLWKEPLFRSEWANQIGQWCVDHFRKYGTAPGRKIKNLYTSWAEKTQDKDKRDLIDKLLSGLSKQWERLTQETEAKFHTDLTLNYFNRVALDKHIDDLKLGLDRGHVEQTVQKAEQFKRFVLDDQDVIDVLTDTAAHKDAIEGRQKVLIKYKGDLGKFFGDELSQESLVALVAPMKVGKSYYMLDMAWQAMKQKRRVAYFQVGDLSRRQVLSRFLARAAYRPLKRKSYHFPLSIVPMVNGVAQVETEVRVCDDPITVAQASKAMAKFAGPETLLRLQCSPTKSISAADIEKTLDRWDRDGWRAEVVVIDYSENLAPDNPHVKPLEQVEETWATLSRVREKRRCSIITAYQSNKEGFTTWVLTRNNFSKNKMILAHATAIIGLNQTVEEKKKQVMRLNFVVRREDAFAETDCCYVAECRDVCHVTVRSFFNERGNI